MIMDIKNYTAYVCPKCKQEVHYIPNPGNYYVCSCGFSGKESHLIKVVDDERVDRDIKRLESFLKHKKLSEYKK